jgi:prepilin-type N-terminal cleavage/methylation domain-containing protein
MKPAGIIRRVAEHTRRAGKDERGTSLVELMVATAVFAIVMSGALVGFNGGFRLTRDDRMRSVAANLASQEMDSVRAQAIQDFTALPIGTVVTTQTVDNADYDISRRDKWIIGNPNAGPCDGASGSQLTEMSVKVTVTWDDMFGTTGVTSQTVLTPPVGTYDPVSGHIGVKVLDQTGAGLDNMPVEVQGPGYDQNQDTESDGCAFFGFLDPGTYTVILNKSGYVTDQGVQNATKTVVVTVGTITSVQFSYARAATVNLTLVGEFGGTVANTVAVTVANTHLLPTGTKSFAGTGTSRSLGSIYPFTEGYQTWAGNCLDADPQAQKTNGSGAFYPGAVRDAPISVQPGGVSTGTVTLESVVITVTRLGVPQTGLTVVATHLADTGCSAGSSLTLGATGAGGVYSAALPYGLWTFTVSGKSPSGSWPQATLNPLDVAAKVVAVAIL